MPIEAWEQKNILDLLTNGTVYFNIIEKSRIEESGDLGGNICEGKTWVSHILNGNVILLHDGEEIPLGSSHTRGFK